MRVVKIIAVSVFALVTMGSSILSLLTSAQNAQKIMDLCLSVRSIEGIPISEKIADTACNFSRFQKEDISKGETTGTTPGRFQIIVRPGIGRDTWLLDTHSGEVWNIYEDPTTKNAWWGVMPKGELKPPTEK